MAGLVWGEGAVGRLKSRLVQMGLLFHCLHVSFPSTEHSLLHKMSCELPKLEHRMLSLIEVSDQDSAVGRSSSSSTNPNPLEWLELRVQMRSSSSGCSHVCHRSHQEVSLVSTNICCPRTHGPCGVLQASVKPGSGWREKSQKKQDSETPKGLSKYPLHS